MNFKQSTFLSFECVCESEIICILSAIFDMAALYFGVGASPRDITG